MKNLVLILTALPLLCSTACAAGTKASAKAKAPQYAAYSLPGGHFSCEVPSGWEQRREADRDAEYKIYELELIAPKSGKLPTVIFLSYYAKDNSDFKNYQNFLDRNSKNLFGETKNARELYEPVKETEVAGRKAYLLAREKLTYLHPQSKSEESAALKERLYVFPAKEGFYVVRYSAEKPLFAQYLKVFEKVAASFKGKY